MRLIDVNKLKENLITEIYSYSKGDIRKRLFARGLSLAYDIVNRQPTVDAVEVVRCKDCKHKPTGSGVNHHITFPEQDYRCPCRCEDYWYSWMPDDDWFCASGERKEDND